MSTDTASSDNVINQMVALRVQRAKLDHQINSLKPLFFKACAAQDKSRFEHEQATISRRLTPGKWDYPERIVEQENRLKQVKQQFQETHEPTTGREVIWSIRLAD